MNRFRAYVPFSKSYEQVIEATSSSPREIDYFIEGVASTVSVDRDEERMSEKALQKMRNDIKTLGVNLFVNHSHNLEDIVGTIVDADVYSTSLGIKAKMADPEVNPKAKLILSNQSKGIKMGLSVGGRVTKTKKEFNKDLNKEIDIIDDLELYEVSVVGIPSNKDCEISIGHQIAKSMKEGTPMVQKFAGQSGEVSYGKMGETTPNQVCPSCGKPSGELMSAEGGPMLYRCHDCGSQYEKMETQDKFYGGPEHQPTNPNFNPNAPQSVLGRKSGGNTMVEKDGLQPLKGKEMDEKPEEEMDENGKPKKKKEEMKGSEGGQSPEEAAMQSNQAGNTITPGFSTPSPPQHDPTQPAGHLHGSAGSRTQSMLGSKSDDSQDLLKKLNSDIDAFVIKRKEELAKEFGANAISENVAPEGMTKGVPQQTAQKSLDIRYRGL